MDSPEFDGGTTLVAQTRLVHRERSAGRIALGLISRFVRTSVADWSDLAPCVRWERDATSDGTGFALRDFSRKRFSRSGR